MKDKKYIERIISYSNKIARYLDGVSSIEVFEANDEKVDAVLLNLEQIGETAKKLSEDFKNNTTTIEWNKIIGLRNLISHEYEGVDLTLIYNIARINIPDLLNKVMKIKI
jgi:uncharacterized protein with HEPN domain